MVDNAYVDYSDAIETFDIDENDRLLREQLALLHDDACESLIDNFKPIYLRYSSILNREEYTDEDTKESIQTAFYDVCELFVSKISDAFNFSVSEKYVEDHYKDLPSLALLFYLFFILDLRSNLYNVLLNVISEGLDELAAHFEDKKGKHDSLTEISKRTMDANVGIIASNIYDVVDYCMENMTPEMYLDHMEEGYIALKPMKDLYDNAEIGGEWIYAIRDFFKENISMKGKICFDIICRLKGIDLNI